MGTNVIGYSIGLEDSSFFIPKEIQQTVRLGKYLDEGHGEGRKDTVVLRARPLSNAMFYSHS